MQTGFCARFDYLISIHALRVEGDDVGFFTRQKTYIISIHALRVEGDVVKVDPTASGEAFLSTPSGWRATTVMV